MSTKKAYFFYELHPANLLLAFVLKLFGDVYVFKYKGWCQRYLRTQFFPSINDFKNIDQWSYNKELALKKVIEFYPEIKKHSPHFSLMSKNVNLENLYVQQFSRDYEFYLFFVVLFNNHIGKKCMLNYSFRRFLQKNHSDLLTEKENSLCFFPLLTDTLYQHVEFLGKMLRAFIFAFKKGSPVSLKHFRYLCSGISPFEYAQKDADLNFSWLVKNQIVKGDDILYLLDIAPNEKSSEYLKKNNIHFISKRDFFISLPFSEKLKTLFNLFTFWLTYSFRMNYQSYFACKSFFSSINASKVFEKTTPTHFLYSLSEGWPEPAESALANSLNIQTIIWFYSSGEFLFSEKYEEYKDHCIRFSINEAKELWVWSPLLRDLISERMIDKSKTSIHIIGPTLNGDMKFLEEKKPAGSKYTIVFFDITPMTVRFRLSEAEGPYTSKEIEEGFYKAVLAIYEAFPEINIILKTKRVLDPFLYDQGPSLKKLRGMENERLVFPTPNQDPYQLIRDADLIISMPFTSPTMLGLSLQKPSVYYNPLNDSRYTFKNAFRDITITDRDELLSFVKKHSEERTEMPRSPHFFVAQNLVESMKESIRRRLN